MKEINLTELIEYNAAGLRDTKGELIGNSDASANIEEYPALEGVAGTPEEKQRVLGEIFNLFSNYEHKYGEEPPDNMVAAAVESANGLSQMVNDVLAKIDDGSEIALEAVSGNLTTQSGVVETLNRTNVIAMEYELDGILSQVATTFPSGTDETHLFEMQRKATKTWGPVAAGAALGIDFSGGLSELDPAVDFVGDAATTDWTLTASHPVFENQAIISLNMDPVGKDDGGFSGAKTISAQEYVITGSFSNYATGEGTLTITPAMPATVTARITRPLDLEDTNGQQYIQGLKYASTKKIVKPVENALDSEQTFHAGLAFQRDYDMDLWAYAQRDLLRTIGTDRSYNAISQMYTAAQFQAGGIATAVVTNDDASKAFSSASPAGVGYSPREHIMTTLPIWLWLQSVELQTNSVYGSMTKIIGANNFVRLLQYLPPELFRRDPGYRNSHDIVYYGLLFGQYKVFYDRKSKIVPADEILMIATSEDQLFHNGFLNSTAIPLNTFSFQMTKLMTRHKRLWTRVYRKLEDPKYFRRAKIS